ncbi:hypothetical protein CAOG_006118 [Capsaspora owczarzaki ATCC 30864]|uniref:Uncharacterized protein n=1 Tax=Capsaspora owczarzaki (strain ATCC 30864) TaxID=595528 RepID=A0A0D2UKU7_CAPO3|nr:hypothetical protein CAOG_006118 [Capsaspora owczarzaki ATCC 30864]
MSDAIEARSRRMLKHITALQSIGLARAAAHHIATVHHAHRDAAAADAADALSAPKSSTSTSSSSSSPSVTAHPAQPVAQGAAAHRRPVAAAGSAVSSALTSLSESLTSLTSLTSIVRAIVQHGSTLSNAGASSSSGSSSALPSGLSSSLASGSSSESEAHHVEAASLKTLPSSPGSFAPSLWLQASSSSLPGPSSSLASASSTLPPSASSSSTSSPAGTATIPSPSDLDAVGDSPQLQRLIEAVARLSAPNAGSAEDDQIASNASVQAVIELLTASIDANAPCLTQRVIGPMPLNQSHDDVQDMRLRITILLAAAKTCTLLWESIFKSALAFTLPLERHVDYWNDKQANPWFYYAQVLPATIFGFGRTLRRNWTFARIVHELLLSPFYKLHQHHAVIHQTKREHIVLLGRLSQWRRALKSSEWEVIMAPLVLVLRERHPRRILIHL